MDSIKEFIIGDTNKFILSLLVIGATAVLIKRLKSNPALIEPKILLNQSVALPNPKKGESPIYRNSIAKEKLLDPEFDGIKTIPEILVEQSKKFSDKPALGTRSTKENGDRGEYVWKTYSEFYELVSNFSSGLVNLGAKPGDKVAVYSHNCEEWLITEHATYQHSMVVVSLYDTLGPSSAKYIIEHSESSIGVVTKATYDKFMDACAEIPKCPVKYLILINPVEDTQRATNLGMKVMNFDEILKLGKSKPAEKIAPKPEDLSNIMYTSGTTGVPKGVMLTHRNVIAAIVGFREQYKEDLNSDVYLSYLPLAHIMERISIVFVLSNGGQVGMFGGVISKLLDDLQTLKPTGFVGAPRVYQRIYDKVINQVESSGPVKRWLFWTAYEAKKRAIAEGRTSPFWDKLVFSKINEKIFGGRVVRMTSGSAPLSTQVHEFLRVCFTPVVVEGFGMTETTAGCTIQKTKDMRTGRVGPPLGVVELKLVDVPERNYFVTDKPQPRGELLVRGHCITQGYYKAPDKTAEAFTEDGWLMTGDIATINEDGTITIIDRKKNIFKLAQGEYVAPEYLENVYCRSQLVAQCFVYGDSLKSQLVAVVIPDEEVVKNWAKQNRIEGEYKTLVQTSTQLKEAVLAEMHEVGKKAKLNGFEIVKAIHLDHELWTLDNGILTPTMKLKRPECYSKFKTQIDSLYSKFN